MGTRVIKAGSDAEAGVVIAKNTVRMNVKEDNGVLVDEKGTTFTGPLSIVSAPNHVRIAGLWTLQNAMVGSLPSTIATPNAMYMIDPPAKQIAGLIGDAAVMIALLGALAAIG